jgi:hypothetical protein
MLKRPKNKAISVAISILCIRLPPFGDADSNAKAKCRLSYEILHCNSSTSKNIAVSFFQRIASVGHRCRIKATELRAKARNERFPMIRAEWKSLERAYSRLAQQSDRKAEANIDPPPPKIDQSSKKQ